MHFLLIVRDLCIDFLFPKQRRVIELEYISASELWETLPHAEKLSNKHEFALFDYKHPVVKELVWEIKYAGNRVIAEKMSQILHDVITEELEEWNIGESEQSIALVPVPISDKRRNERGWNQTEILADKLAGMDGGKKFKYIPRQLVKIQHTESQTKLGSRNERLKNLKDTMIVNNRDKFRGKDVVVIDDVTTTGATFTEVRRALKDAGAKRVICFALAH